MMLPCVSFAATILVWGDSLSAGYGLPQGSAWPTLLEQRLQREGYRYQVVNASISGETTAGGLARLPEALGRHKPALLIIELGANDGLRGQALSQMKENLAKMITSAQATHAKVLLLGMRLPPNLGPVYTQKFQSTYRELASEYKTSLIPFFLEKIAAQPDMFQADSIHPIAQAQPIILDTIWAGVKPLLKK